MTIIFNDDFIFFPSDEKTAQKLDAAYVKSKGLYRIPLNLGAIRELYAIYPDTKLLELGKKMRSHYDDVLKAKNLADISGPNELRPYQRVDVSFLQTLPHKAILNQQRTGKTPTTLKLIQIEGHKKVIIVTPASLRNNWEEEILSWLGKTSIVISGTKTKRDKLYQEFNKSTENILIISYETLRNDYDTLLKPFDCLILDESHRIRNIKTKQTKAVNKLGKMAKTRIALTGTPAVNHASDIYGILSFLYPQKFPSYWQFVERYFKVQDGHFGKKLGKAKREKELQDLLQTLSIQRKRADIMNWIPDVTHRTIKLDADAVQLQAYNMMLKTFEVEQDGELLVDAPSPLAQLTRLRQITLDPSLLKLKGNSPKEQFILDYIEDNPNEPIIIFSTFTSFLRTLQKKIPHSLTIFGEQSSTEKQENVRKFQLGKSNILLANIISGGTGFTIDRAETIIFLDRSFNPIDNEQASDRFIPTQETNKADKRTVIDLVIKGTVDEKITTLLKEKKSIIDMVNSYGIGVILD